ncbi:MAG: hypothetical protein LQ351_000692 [Letrouitia transgressa]|nr:MAG: hypothetical protein LQ351_000692 [Letrouitia transgressa]
MGVSILFGRTLDLIALGHAIVLVFFCGGGLGFVGWIKQRLGNPLVNIACSLTSLAIITVLTKEGAVQAASFSDDKIVQVLKMIIMGVIATTAVSLLISPISARTDLRDNMISVTDSFAEILIMITRGFLSGLEDETKTKQYQKWTDQYKKALASLDKSLREAKFEHYVFGTEREYNLEARLVECMQRLAQNIGGLRGAASTQFLLLAQSSTGIAGQHFSLSSTPISDIDQVMTPPSDQHGIFIATGSEGEALGRETYTPHFQGYSEDVTEDQSISSPADIFKEFIFHLGPSMKSLAFTLREILGELPFGPGPEYQIAIDAHFKPSLEEAIELYTTARETALSLVYRNKEINKHRSFEIEADFEEIAASCGVFSYSLQDFGKETGNFLDILMELKDEIDCRPEGRTWAWLKPWSKSWKSSVFNQGKDVERDAHNNGILETAPEFDIRSPPQRESSFKGQAIESRSLSYKQRLWRALSVFRRDDTKFAIKVGVGAALYAMPSFISSTRPMYQHFRGEWGLLSYMLVCSMTIGASNTTGYSRFLGTCLGAVCAVIAWTISQGNVFALAALGWLMALWTAYIIVAQGRGPMGRFIMLTYNLSALYAYSLSVKDLEDDDDEGGISPIISEIAFHRVVAVMSGCLWGLIVTRVIWPISAREKLKNGLAMLWLRMGLIWKRPSLEIKESGLPTRRSYMDLREEYEFQRFMANLENFRSAASSEMNLKGPFPKSTYEQILKCTNSMLDAFHAMNVMIMKEPTASRGEAAILRYTVDERAQLSARLSHLFQVMASSMKLEYPLTGALPSITHARDRLLAKVFQFRRKEKDASGATDKDFALLYAYAMVTGHLGKQIEEIGKELERLFGILDEDALKLQ